GLVALDRIGVALQDRGLRSQDVVLVFLSHRDRTGLVAIEASLALAPELGNAGLDGAGHGLVGAPPMQVRVGGQVVGRDRDRVDRGVDGERPLLRGVRAIVVAGFRALLAHVTAILAAALVAAALDLHRIRVAVVVVHAGAVALTGGAHP